MRIIPTPQDKEQSVHPCPSSFGVPLCPQAAFDVVAIVASEGVLAALRTVLAALPLELPAALMVQFHFPPDGPSLLVDLLQSHTPLTVTWAGNGERLRPGTVRVVPPGQHVQVSPSGVLTLTSWTRRGRTKPRFDDLFASVAASFRARALGVILTGNLSDGVRGAQILQQHGGRVLVQDPATATAASMPAATLETGSADLVLSLDALPAAITALVMMRGLAQFLKVPSLPQPQLYREALRIWGV